MRKTELWVTWFWKISTKLNKSSLFFFEPDVPGTMFCFVFSNWLYSFQISIREGSSRTEEGRGGFKLDKMQNVLDLTPFHDFPAGQLDLQLSVEFVGSRWRLHTGFGGNIGRTPKSPDAVCCFYSSLAKYKCKVILLFFFFLLISFPILWFRRVAGRSPFLVLSQTKRQWFAAQC